MVNAMLSMATVVARPSPSLITPVPSNGCTAFNGAAKEFVDDSGPSLVSTAATCALLVEDKVLSAMCPHHLFTPPSCWLADI
ncbi:hypothetical protein F2Q68_00030074 [Brassica cretica]|uniref:Uncharacterized protein n=1 Tax=Brassica cretica TaxID=69181 RepID=A0A8S9G585_BRACR|nr:hypothetical protein F2Q68_00030074 [Brassica cretica]